MTAMNPIHYIRAWTGTETDETPICGADKWAPEVWGSRTNYVNLVSCEECRRLLRLPPLTREEKKENRHA